MFKKLIYSILAVTAGGSIKGRGKVGIDLIAATAIIGGYTVLIYNRDYR